MLLKNFAKLRISSAVQQCRGHTTVCVTTSCSLLVVMRVRVSVCSRLDLHVFISARQSASRTCMHSNCTNSPLPGTTLHRYRLWREITVGEPEPYPTADSQVTK